ncbi:MAG: ADP-ribose diphosphatase [Rhodospirillales bacterium]|jgi:ADP-ribose pyrophosphatase|uniref:NUDIX domain-containing protein n=1 Tax=Hwanghaeella sp. 1Z406 TaxID=3402811 RepID=UPI000C902241|nr:ADP-ribose diphosphatase [Rhodospirillales bacterium]|tara:strand:+ start:1070 stop:1669 length:600 start_codon:yes stop_codon:yes gene_type:complete
MARMVELILREIPFKGYFQVSRYHLRHTQFKGGMGPRISREVFERGHAVCVVPYDPIRDEIALIEQFRPGAYAAGDPDPWLIEVVAGIIDANETLEDVARRESLEETGLTISALDYLGKHYMTPGGSSESIAMYAGCADFTRLGGLHGMADEGEDIRVFAVPAREAIAMVHDNRIRNAMTALALLLFESRRQVLRRDWQ